jgi:biopolymer transport protein ExbD
MAEMIQQGAGSRSGRGRIRAKKLSTRIDMTPMVDLAFLLLTFFILTSSLQKSMVMGLTMPDKSDSTRQDINYKNVLHCVLADHNKIFYWTGDEQAKETTFSANGVRQILLTQKNNPQLMVLIKPGDDSKYQNMVDFLDEIAITNVERYAIVDFSSDDKAKIELAVDR